MRAALLVFALMAFSAHAADTPLSMILIDGEGWKPVKAGIGITWSNDSYVSRKDDKGRWAVYKGKKLVARAAEGESFGKTALSPKGGQLVVAVPSHHYLWTFQVKADGSLTAKEKCYVLRREKLGKGGSQVGNMVFDSKRRLFVAMPGGVQYFDEEMRFSGQLSRPVRQPVKRVAFLGNHLYIECGDGTLWKRKVQATGATPAGR